MDNYADLEIGLHRREVDVYSVDFRFVQPGGDADVRLGQGTARFDIKALKKLPPGGAEYARQLSDGLFGDASVQGAFVQAETSAASQRLSLRVRLLIGPGAPELHTLQWETLLHPKTGAPLSTNENIVFSRYITSQDWRPVLLRPQGQLSVLVVVASPSNLSEFENLADIDPGGELDRARQALGDAAVTTISDPKDKKPATLNNIIAALRDGTQDVLYLVCHGAYTTEPLLWLEDEDGKAAVTPGKTLVTRLNELTDRPQLVVLASCQSAGHPTAGDALGALGPSMADAGVPAVVAMQGRISLTTIAKFMPAFFRQLQESGQIDQAMAVARGEVRDQPDYWMPALFMRLRSGRIWYVPGFGDESGDFEKWRSIIRTITKGQCTPILGPGLSESLLGSQMEMARRWAETYKYPMAPHERESLPQVAQYLKVNQYERAPYDELEEYLTSDITKRFGDRLPEGSSQGGLNNLIVATGALENAYRSINPYGVLAQLPLPVFITTSWSDLLDAALRKENKEPRVVLCPWNVDKDQADPIYKTEQGYLPTVKAPLVYHLFGHFSHPESIVLTEDDYFDFLIGVTRNNELIPSVVRRSLADAALLFLGFQMDDWQFRVLFRSILAQPGGERRARYPQVAVQLEPEEGRLLEPERARRYLNDYFFTGAKISLFWGRSDDFIKELKQRMSSPAA